MDAETPSTIFDQLARDPDQLMADGVRIRMIERTTARDGVEALAARPDFRSAAVQRKARERIAVLEASEAISDDQLIAVVATRFKRAQLILLARRDLAAIVLDALGRDGATKAISTEPTIASVGGSSRTPHDARC